MPTVSRANTTVTEPQVAYKPQPPPLLARLRGNLKAEIEGGLVSVNRKGDYIAIRLGKVLRFKSGSANLGGDVTGLMQRVTQALEAEPGEIVIEGHSDNIPLRGTGRFRTNEQLSEARATTVRDLLARYLSDASRMTVVGMGASDPIDPANTRQARAINRRVEILVRREGSR